MSGGAVSIRERERQSKGRLTRFGAFDEHYFVTVGICEGHAGRLVQSRS
jgi:hypothetical protein